MILLLLACVRPTPPGPSPAEARAQLPEPLVMEDAELGQSLIHVSVRAGSAVDPEGLEGAAWLTAAAIAASPEALALRELGGTLDVEVGRELARYTLRCPPDASAEAAALLGGALVALTVDEDGLASLRGQALSALEATQRDPLALALVAADLWLHEGHPYGHPVPGRRGSLATITPRSLEELHQERYQRHHVALGVGGEVVPAATEALQRALEGLPVGHSEPTTPKPRPIVDDVRGLIIDAPVDRAAAAVGLPLPRPRGAEDSLRDALLITAMEGWWPASSPVTAEAEAGDPLPELRVESVLVLPVAPSDDLVAGVDAALSRLKPGADPQRPTASVAAETLSAELRRSSAELATRLERAAGARLLSYPWVDPQRVDDMDTEPLNLYDRLPSPPAARVVMVLPEGAPAPQRATPATGLPPDDPVEEMTDAPVSSTGANEPGGVPSSSDPAPPLQPTTWSRIPAQGVFR